MDAIVLVLILNHSFAVITIIPAAGIVRNPNFLFYHINYYYMLHCEHFDSFEKISQILQRI